MKSLRKALIPLLFVGFLFALHGKIVFYDGTYVVGKVTKVDESSVYIIPIGLDTPEGVLVGNIDSLKIENGMIPVLSSAVKYFYQNGEFIANNDDWMDEYDDFKYDDYIALPDEYKYEEDKKSHSDYYSVIAFGGMPMPMASLQDSLNKTKLDFNLGLGFHAPYYPVGALDISPGLNIMTFGFDNIDMGTVTAFQAVGNLSIDFKPILYFLPEPMHFCIDLGINYNTALKNEPSIMALSHIEYDGKPSYGGIGLNFGSSIDYHFSSLPVGLRFFMNSNVIPQGEPWTELKTGFFNVGLKLVVILKRHR